MFAVGADVCCCLLSAGDVVVCDGVLLFLLELHDVCC